MSKSNKVKKHIPTGIEAEVCKDIADRQALGIAKYGTTVADNPLSLSQWLQHSLEETLDNAVYLKRAISEIGKIMDEHAIKKEGKTLRQYFEGFNDRDKKELKNKTKRKRKR